MDERCGCKTSSGKRCLRKPKEGKKFCWQHVQCSASKKIVSKAKPAPVSKAKLITSWGQKIPLHYLSIIDKVSNIILQHISQKHQKQFQKFLKDGRVYINDEDDRLVSFNKKIIESSGDGNDIDFLTADVSFGFAFEFGGGKAPFRDWYTPFGKSEADGDAWLVDVQRSLQEIYPEASVESDTDHGYQGISINGLQ